MRKIEHEMIQAINHKKDWRKDNTSVYWSELSNCCTVKLHGNVIMQWWPEAGELQLFDGGWQTVTTKSRLNAICDRFNLKRIRQEKYIWKQVDMYWLSGTVYKV